MTNQETILVIDGHKLDIDGKELSMTNDVRQVYDANLVQSIYNLNNSIKEKEIKELSNNEIKVDLSKKEKNIHILNGIVFEITTKDRLIINLYKDNENVFSLRTNENFVLPTENYSSDIKTLDKNVHYFSDGNSTVLSNLVTHKIIKYSSSEEINKHLYTKYYEFVEKHNLGFYLLMADFKPLSLTCYDYNKKNNKAIIIFE